MNVTNIILTFVVLILAGVLLRYFIQKNKKSTPEETLDVDDKTYTIEKMTEFIKKRLDEITKINLYDIGLSEEELKRRNLTSRFDYDDAYPFCEMLKNQIE